jgi:heparan-alpha-glucosaminide N-acetyltransferase
MSSVTFAADAEGIGPLLALRLPLRRVLAIDAFRGLTILAMIFVNTLEDVHGMPSWLYHTPENSEGLTFPDLVFPAFLFIVGMSIPFATAQRLAAGDTVWRLLRHVLMRTLGLLVLGVFMVNAEEGYNERAMPLSIGLWSLLFYTSALMVWGVYQFQNKALAAGLRVAGVAGLIALALLFRGGDDGSVPLSPQWWGILGLIGWSYLFASAMYLLGRGRIMPLMIGLFLWLIYYCLAQMDAVQASPVLQLLAGQSDNAAHISIVLCGVMTTLFFFDASGEETPQRFGSAALLALTLVGLGALLQPYYGVSKTWGTPSWAFYSAALCVVLFAFLYWLIDLRGARGWTVFLRPAAANPLLIYMLPNIVAALMKCLHLGLPASFTEGMTGLVWAIAYAFCVLAFAHHMRIRLQL